MNGRRVQRWHVLSGLIIALSVGTVTLASHPSLTAPLATVSPPGTYQIAHDVDGDTIVVKMEGKDETVRLIGMDTPETHDPRKPVQCFGQAAAAETSRLIAGKAVQLVADPVTTDRDKYHRLLRYVYLPDGTFLNQYLVQQGYAFAYVVFPNSKLDQFRSWEAEARAANRGLWSGCQVHSDGAIEQTQGL